jgi:dihydrolipoamide dehydrogenase
MMRADKVLAAFGRVPNTEDIGLASVGVRCDERGRIVTGDYGETSVRGIYAIGDVTCGPALAHVASREAEIAVDHIFRGELAWPQTVAPDLVPSAVYCEPQLAGFGLREEEAEAKGLPFKKSVFPYRGAGKSVALERTEGFVKILADPETGEILGAHVVGAEATELIHELLLARHGELLVDDVASMIHAHPTLSETIMEAARGVHGRPIHL